MQWRRGGEAAAQKWLNGLLRIQAEGGVRLQVCADGQDLGQHAGQVVDSWWRAGGWSDTLLRQFVLASLSGSARPDHTAENVWLQFVCRYQPFWRQRVRVGMRVQASLPVDCDT